MNQVWSDLFAGVDGTNLSSHIPVVGSGYTKKTGATEATIQANKLQYTHGAGAVTTTYQCDGILPLNFHARMKLTVTALVGEVKAGIIGRINYAAGSGFQVSVDKTPGGSQILLEIFDGGNFWTFSKDVIVATGTEYTLDLWVSDSRVFITLNGVLAINVQDTNVGRMLGRPGLLFAADDATVILDDLLIEELS